MERAKIGFIVGLRAEARLLRGLGFAVGIGGGTPEGAAAQAALLVDLGARALVSFGLAGGLDPALAPGAIVIPKIVARAGQTYACDADLTAWLGGATVGTLLAGAEIAVSVADKAALFAGTGAAAIDLESGAVARLAAERAMPFAALRAVCDPAGRDLPLAALAALDAAGAIGGLRVLGSILRQPAQLPTLIALAGDAGRARAALRKKLRSLFSSQTT
jgi:adenosylhomocysteine nucleosidase